MAIGHGDVLDTPVTTGDVGLQRKGWGRERRGNKAENVNLSETRRPEG